MKSLLLMAALLGVSLVNAAATDSARRPVIVISDIDDTIKDTGVLKEPANTTHSATYRKNYAHLAGDPFRPWKPVDGMAARFRLWSRHGSAQFIYLSKGPWCYRSRVLRFLRTNRFPAGDVALNPHFPISPPGYKRAPIESIIRAHPGCAFVLVGDSGEDDPEVYGQIAARFPDSGCHIFIRDITPHGPSRRFAAAFADVPQTRWQLFTRASQLPATPLDRSTKLPLSHVHASPAHRR